MHRHAEAKGEAAARINVTPFSDIPSGAFQSDKRDNTEHTTLRPPVECSERTRVIRDPDKQPDTVLNVWFNHHIFEMKLLSLPLPKAIIIYVSTQSRGDKTRQTAKQAESCNMETFTLVITESDREIVNLLRLLQAQQPSGLTGYYSSHVASQIG